MKVDGSSSGIRFLLAAGIACASLLAATTEARQAVPAPRVNTLPWDGFVSRYIESYFKAHPDAAVSAGRHEYDGILPDWTPEGLKAEVHRLHEERDRAAAYRDEDLDARQRFERDYLIAQTDKDLFWLETADGPHRNPLYYGDALDPDVYVSREYAPLPVRLRAYTRYARAVPKAVAELRGNVRLPLPRTWIKISRRALGGLAGFYAEDVPKVFAPVKDEALQAHFREANAGAIAAIKDLDAWLAAQEPHATEDFALGAETFRTMLRATERVDVPLDQLERIGRADLERNLAALKDACGRFEPGASIDACVAKVQSDKPEGDPVAAARKQLDMLRRFVAEHSLVTIPGPEQALVREAPPYKASNSAYINIPGPYENGLPSIYYIAPPDTSWPKEKQLEYLPDKAMLLFTSVHEVWPGHFLQYEHANRAKSKFGQIFVGYAFAEGWAHYSEEMMWEAGLGNGDPETHVGQIREALLRNVRFLSAIDLHTQGMTVAESEKMFREQGYQDPGNAEQQAERGTYDPAYLNYCMGKLMIRKLRADWTATRGGRAAWKAFHDAFLSYGGPPIPLVRRAMLGTDAGTLF
jgi:Bacterial protein of unknown function (DUF885)